jgi:hypothetical protein
MKLQNLTYEFLMVGYGTEEWKTDMKSKRVDVSSALPNCGHRQLLSFRGQNYGI